LTLWKNGRAITLSSAIVPASALANVTLDAVGGINDLGWIAVTGYDSSVSQYLGYVLVPVP
jgi:hypothetical protein